MPGKPRRLLRKPIITVSLALAATLLFPSPAHAGDKRVEIYNDGALKTVATYDDSSNTFCVKTYNGTSSANSQIEIYRDGVFRGELVDRGGDQFQSCVNRSHFEQAPPENAAWSGTVCWYGSGPDFHCRNWNGTY